MKSNIQEVGGKYDWDINKMLDDRFPKNPVRYCETCGKKELCVEKRLVKYDRNNGKPIYVDLYKCETALENDKSLLRRFMRFWDPIKYC